MGLIRRGAWYAAAAAALAVALGAAPGTAAGGAITPGAAAGGVPLGTTEDKVQTILGQPSAQLQDPTNPRIVIERWETRCLGARYTTRGALLALDIWADLGEQCGAAAAVYGVDGLGGRRVTFASTRGDVKAAFGDAPDRVLHAATFAVLVYDDQGIAFYVREEGPRRGLVDSITVFPRGASETVWAPASWGG